MVTTFKGDEDPTKGIQLDERLIPSMALSDLKNNSGTKDS